MKSIEYEVNPLQQNQSNCRQHKISELWHPHPLQQNQINMQQNQINRSLSCLGEGSMTALPIRRIRSLCTIRV